MAIQNKYPPKDHFVFLFANGKGVRVSASQYETTGPRRKLTNIYSKASEIVAVFYETKEPFDLLLTASDRRAILIKSSLIPEAATRTSGGSTLLSLKKGHKLVSVVKDPDDLPDGGKGLRKIKVPATGVLLSMK